jgi:hypothetical protein
MEHVSEFDRLLEDRAYRAQLLDGNITIERTISRMSQMLNDYLIDMSIFREANNGLDLYLLDIGIEWTYHNDDVRKIYSAMCGNTGGWSQFLQSLVAKAERLGVVLVQVSSYCNEIEKRCGAASRRSLVCIPFSTRPGLEGGMPLDTVHPTDARHRLQHVLLREIRQIRATMVSDLLRKTRTCRRCRTSALLSSTLRTVAAQLLLMRTCRINSVCPERYTAIKYTGLRALTTPRRRSEAKSRLHQGLLILT